eukprot:CAMPEP_0117683694 /NCGR_PEP_ID=MMETSP0804-20121206/20582_1 /TAXON_ID=1074897 /ORGANISM="Tetraselmis astigmatica, Strain CCMP880" /LENGTH=606 /DNA_ID=CAMNT_0005494395 /DNA_START=75 /DNA_END=1895 /DNA_ORIENTATION=+
MRRSVSLRGRAAGHRSAVGSVPAFVPPSSSTPGLGGRRRSAAASTKPKPYSDSDDDDWWMESSATQARESPEVPTDSGTGSDSCLKTPGEDPKPQRQQERRDSGSDESTEGSSGSITGRESAGVSTPDRDEEPPATSRKHVKGPASEQSAEIEEDWDSDDAKATTEPPGPGSRLRLERQMETMMEQIDGLQATMKHITARVTQDGPRIAALEEAVPRLQVSDIGGADRQAEDAEERLVAGPSGADLQVAVKDAVSAQLGEALQSQMPAIITEILSKVETRLVSFMASQQTSEGKSDNAQHKGTGKARVRKAPVVRSLLWQASDEEATLKAHSSRAPSSEEEAQPDLDSGNDGCARQPFPPAEQQEDPSERPVSPIFDMDSADGAAALSLFDLDAVTPRSVPVTPTSGSNTDGTTEEGTFTAAEPHPVSRGCHQLLKMESFGDWNGRPSVECLTVLSRDPSRCHLLSVPSPIQESPFSEKSTPLKSSLSPRQLLLFNDGVEVTDAYAEADAAREQAASPPSPGAVSPAMAPSSHVSARYTRRVSTASTRSFGASLEEPIVEKHSPLVDGAAVAVAAFVMMVAVLLLTAGLEANGLIPTRAATELLGL